MKQFGDLFLALDSTTSSNQKVAALVNYFHCASAADNAWAIKLLSGKRLKRLVSRPQLKQWLMELTELPEWLVLDAYSTVGDFAETVSLLLPTVDEKTPVDPAIAARSLQAWMEEHIQQLPKLSEQDRATTVKNWWQSLPQQSVFLVTKLMTGALRVGVSQGIVAKAISQFAGLPKDVVLHRLMGDWQPSEEFFKALIDPDIQQTQSARPYPFYLASPLEKSPADLGDIQQWQAEWKWDGIRAQLVVRDDEVHLWSRGEELISEQFPELIEFAAADLSNCVLDGELLAWRDGRVRPFADLQKRLGRKKPGKKILQQYPIKFLCYDCVEIDYQDIRSKPLAQRREHLGKCLFEHIDSQRIGLSPLLHAEDWQTLAQQREHSRERGVEGLMLKQLDSPYQVGRKRGHWWKWKIDPLTVDAVMIYAQSGSGRRATLFTDYTFAVWKDKELVPLAKAYSGLTDREINSLNTWIRRNTIERFGPVRSVKAEQVFEIAFEGINASKRHKSGVALRFPRIARWRSDMRAQDANTLTQVKELLTLYA